MKRWFGLCLAVAMLAVAPLSAEVVEGILVDKACSAGIAKKGYEAAKGHTRDCALMDNCKASGFGVVTAEGKFLKFDRAGDDMALEGLEDNDQKDNIAVTVEGAIEGEAISVESLEFM